MNLIKLGFEPINVTDYGLDPKKYKNIPTGFGTPDEFKKDP